MSHSYLSDFISRDLQNKISLQDRERIKLAKQVLDETLSKTAHIPVVTSVSIGAAVCSFKARLIEAIGVVKDQYVFKDRIMGEGSDLHKILAVASLLYFNKGYSIPESVKTALDDVRQHLRKTSVDQDDGKLFIDAVQLFEALVQNLDKFAKVLNVERDRLEPVVEQTLIDYDVHLRGIPDLILEDKKTKKAIVVEWKTGGYGTPSEYERAQVLAYAVLEARRLGYPVEELESAIIGTLDDEGRVKGFSVLPVIIRISARGEIYPHPALAPPLKVRERYKELKDILRRILIEAEHLTVLLTNQRELTGVDPEDLKISLPSNPSVKVNVLRYTPSILRRGVPKTQNTWPCVSRNKKPICEYIEPCKFYFGEFGEKEDYERILWGLRFEALGEREKMLAIYRGLHEFFKYNILLKKLDVNKTLDQICSPEGYVCKGIIVVLANPPKINIAERFHKRRLCKEMIVLRDDKELFNGRLDIIEKIDIREDGGVVRALRRVENHEKDVEHGFVPRVIREGTPVLLSLMDSWSPLLSTSIFGRIDEVRFMENHIEYQIGFPSRLLELQKHLFRYYIDKSLQGRFLMSEVNVDLTKADLESIDALQRSLRKKIKDGDVEMNKLHPMELNAPKEQERKLQVEYGEVVASFENILRKILTRKKR